MKAWVSFAVVTVLASSVFACATAPDPEPAPEVEESTAAINLGTWTHCEYQFAGAWCQWSPHTDGVCVAPWKCAPKTAFGGSNFAQKVTR